MEDSKLVLEKHGVENYFNEQANEQIPLQWQQNDKSL